MIPDEMVEAALIAYDAAIQETDPHIFNLKEWMKNAEYTAMCKALEAAALHKAAGPHKFAEIQGDLGYRLALKASEDWLDKMCSHENCCGVPEMRRLLSVLQQSPSTRSEVVEECAKAAYGFIMSGNTAFISQNNEFVYRICAAIRTKTVK